MIGTNGIGPFKRIDTVKGKQITKDELRLVAPSSKCSSTCPNPSPPKRTPSQP